MSDSRGLTLLDRLQNELEEKEERVKDKNKRMRAATGAHYGLNSSQYEGVGGTRPDDKRPSRKKSGAS